MSLSQAINPSTRLAGIPPCEALHLQMIRARRAASSYNDLHVSLHQMGDLIQKKQKSGLLIKPLLETSFAVNANSSAVCRNNRRFGHLNVSNVVLLALTQSTRIKSSRIPHTCACNSGLRHLVPSCVHECDSEQRETTGFTPSARTKTPMDIYNLERPQVNLSGPNEDPVTGGRSTCIR